MFLHNQVTQKPILLGLGVRGLRTFLCERVHGCLRHVLEHGAPEQRKQLVEAPSHPLEGTKGLKGTFHLVELR